MRTDSELHRSRRSATAARPRPRTTSTTPLGSACAKSPSDKPRLARRRPGRTSASIWVGSRSTAGKGRTHSYARRCISWTTSNALLWWRRAPRAATALRRSSYATVRQPSRLGQPGVGRLGTDHLLRGVSPVRQHFLPGGAQCYGSEPEAVSIHWQGAG